MPGKSSHSRRPDVGIVDGVPWYEFGSLTRLLAYVVQVVCHQRCCDRTAMLRPIQIKCLNSCVCQPAHTKKAPPKINHGRRACTLRAHTYRNTHIHTQTHRHAQCTVLCAMRRESRLFTNKRMCATWTRQCAHTHTHRHTRPERDGDGDVCTLFAPAE